MEHAAMMIEAFDFLRDNNLLTPGILACALAVVAYQLGKAIKELQTELRGVSAQQADTAATLKTTAAILARIDETGTKAEISRRDRLYGRWESQGSR